MQLVEVGGHQAALRVVPGLVPMRERASWPMGRPLAGKLPWVLRWARQTTRLACLRTGPPGRNAGLQAARPPSPHRLADHEKGHRRHLPLRLDGAFRLQPASPSTAPAKPSGRAPADQTGRKGHERMHGISPLEGAAGERRSCRVDGPGSPPAEWTAVDDSLLLIQSFKPGPRTQPSAVTADGERLGWQSRPASWGRAQASGACADSRLALKVCKSPAARRRQCCRREWAVRGRWRPGPAMAVPSQRVTTKPGQPRVVEGLDLMQGVLAHVAVDDQQHLVGCALHVCGLADRPL